MYLLNQKMYTTDIISIVKFNLHYFIFKNVTEMIHTNIQETFPSLTRLLPAPLPLQLIVP
jgi:hypothetical protein